MWRRLFVVLAIAGLISLVGIGGANAATLTWTPSTTWTDGSPYEPGIVVTYDIQVDGATQATGVSGTSWAIPQAVIGHGKAVTFTARTVLSTGEMSIWTPPFPWTSPVGIASPPAGMSVTP